MPNAKPAQKTRKTAKKKSSSSLLSTPFILRNKPAVIFIIGFALIGVVTLLSTFAYSRSAADWNKYAPALRQCESSGNYTLNDHNAYFGAYQFDRGTWKSLDGYRVYHYKRADLAPKNIQDLSAYHLFLRRGLLPWPACKPVALRHAYRGSASSTGGAAPAAPANPVSPPPPTNTAGGVSAGSIR